MRALANFYKPTAAEQLDAHFGAGGPAGQVARFVRSETADPLARFGVRGVARTVTAGLGVASYYDAAESPANASKVDWLGVPATRPQATSTAPMRWSDVGALRPIQQMLNEQVLPVLSRVTGPEGCFAKSLQSEAPAARMLRAVVGETPVSRALNEQFSVSDVSPSFPFLKWGIAVDRASTVPSGARVREVPPARKPDIWSLFGPSSPQPRAMSVSPLAAFLKGMSSALPVRPVFQDAAPIWAPAPEQEVLELDAVETAESARDLIKVSDSETQEGLATAEAFLGRLGLEEEGEHLRGIPVLLSEGGPKRVHAALSASIVLKHLAMRIAPACEGRWVDRFNHTYQLGGRNYVNRLIAFVGWHLSGQLDEDEERDFVGAMNSLKPWIGAGHHLPMSSEVAEYHLSQLARGLSVIARAYYARPR